MEIECDRDSYKIKNTDAAQTPLASGRVVYSYSRGYASFFWVQAANGNVSGLCSGSLWAPFPGPLRDEIFSQLDRLAP
jgi:hypothetical protein